MVLCICNNFQSSCEYLLISYCRKVQMHLQGTVLMLRLSLYLSIHITFIESLTKVCQLYRHEQCELSIMTQMCLVIQVLPNSAVVGEKGCKCQIAQHYGLFFWEMVELNGFEPMTSTRSYKSIIVWLPPLVTLEELSSYSVFVTILCHLAFYYLNKIYL